MKKFLLTSVLAILFLNVNAQNVPTAVTEQDFFPGVKCFQTRMQYYDSASATIDPLFSQTNSHCRDEKGRKMLDKIDYDDYNVEDVMDTTFYSADGKKCTHWEVYPNGQHSEDVAEFNEKGLRMKGTSENGNAWMDYKYAPDGKLLQTDQTANLIDYQNKYVYDQKGNCVSVTSYDDAGFTGNGGAGFIETGIDSTVYNAGGFVVKKIRGTSYNPNEVGHLGIEYNYDSTLYTMKGDLVVRAEHFNSDGTSAVGVYTYDNEGKMISECDSSGVKKKDVTLTYYTYDKRGNLSSKITKDKSGTKTEIWKTTYNEKALPVHCEYDYKDKGMLIYDWTYEN